MKFYKKIVVPLNPIFLRRQKIMHHLIFLQIRRRMYEVIGYGRLYSTLLYST